MFEGVHIAESGQFALFAFVFIVDTQAYGPLVLQLDPGSTRSVISPTDVEDLEIPWETFPAGEPVPLDGRAVPASQARVLVILGLESPRTYGYWIDAALIPPASFLDDFVSRLGLDVLMRLNLRDNGDTFIANVVSADLYLDGPDYPSA